MEFWINRIISKHKKNPHPRRKNKVMMKLLKKLRKIINKKIRTLMILNLKIISINHNYQISKDYFKELLIKIKKIFNQEQ